ncbi:sulfurtransferase [Quadrisphaera sp. KR29]|uniref:sulfurtransferase n=1 Tax=Quadrisphaera sp. KR29 TaxID=3461391 RepID=UPI0040444B3A
MPDAPAARPWSPPSVPPFVDAAWLDAQPERVVLADVRWYPDGRSPQEAHAAGHLPGAVRVDVDAVLAAPPSDAGGRHPLPAPDAFLRALASLGLRPGSGSGGPVLVAYDDAGGVIAARLVWMLRALGRQAALLDGGLLAWTAAGRPVARGDVHRDLVEPAAGPAEELPTAWPAALLADADDAARAASDPRAVLLDARPAERYAGAPDALDPRAGHVPGAVSSPVRDDVDALGRLLPDDVLRERLAAAGVVVGDDGDGGGGDGGGGGGAQDVVSSCGSGVTACHRLLVLEHLGVRGARLWPGSWSQWSRDPARPVATGTPPGARGARVEP